MSFRGLFTTLAADRGVAEAISDAKAGLSANELDCAPAGRPPLIGTLAAATDRPILVVTSTFREAEQQTAVLGSLLGEDQVTYYPAWETLPHERLSPRSDTVGRRLAVLRAIKGKGEQPAPKVVVAPIRSMLQPQVAGLADLRPVALKVGADYEMSRLTADLVAAAYQRVDLVERRGEFAVRGGIVDVFPPTEEHPVRIDFFGDEIDTITYFHVADQRSTDDTVDRIIAAPCRELLLTKKVRARAAALIDDHPELSEMLEKIAEGQATEGMEALIPALVDKLELLIDVLPPSTLILVNDPELVRTRAEDLVRTSLEFLHAGWASAASGGKAPIDMGASAYQQLADVRSHALERGQSWWSLSPFVSSPDAEDTEQLGLADVGSWHGDVSGFVQQISQDVSDGWRVLLSVEGSGQASRMAEVLRDNDIPSHIVDDLDQLPEPEPVVQIFRSGMHSGWRAPGIKLVVHAASDITGALPTAERSARKMPTKRRNQVVPMELKKGDPLVHQQHGVGRYVEMVTRTVAGATREYLVVEYAPSKRGQPGDRLYVPMDQLDEVSRYVGGETPQLDKMGGADWKARKSRARKAVREIAAGLIKLYAARQATKGHAFGPDTPWQRELEDSFSFTETPDQLSCINDVKHDMEQIIPMDRLVCGDVGYGKTEIAVRAAFKAVQDGKQVAILVPTTLLVQQHTQTFADRYAGFPVTIASLSRFQSAAETKKTIEGLASGRVDVVIGTHRLLSESVHFKDLGLVIVDEEQRFGVEHKEALKKMRVNVDVLSMSATPIPRTLEMAVTGIREMSTIATPPEERHPVLTFAGGYDQGQVAAAIRRELAREGQVFYVHNRVQDIEKVAGEIRQAVPEATIVTAHGKMGERALEKVMFDFWERRIDVLVCTTIVEAGIDVSTANTLIVDRADRMGLSQLHQLRGRVGRSRERGYAYFLYPPEKPLTETAHDRLSALAANNDLGAGMAIAMKDLEIRGAGNLLGDEQSGHIADVGFDLYIRMVGEAVADYRGEDTGEEEAEMRIELPVDAHLPTDYVESERLRLEMYRRLAEVRSEDDIAQVRDELCDRYGPLPAPTEALLDVARFRLACREAGITEVMAQGNFIRFAPVAELPESRQLRLQRVHPGTLIKAQANVALVPRPRTSGVPSVAVEGEDLLKWASQVVAIFNTRQLASART
ncbi:transcription-repair coupling factor [Propionimicrobium sp. PCR01-08-3]|uniref:transcription-repair coupling factor n=1 Tax=Propionimicrobium sp. PCR01-08-3 TaxID=3052086 RepID=UPI00255C5AAB|nr:transcription-repair coupling factor [Propionimicrobium sp. PCR01-08-3]WIY83030.1 transcription-repair coupling factor [Propionimicrobium sp. PCR01-08-3]